MSEYIKRDDAAELAIAELEAICVTSPAVKAKVRSDYEQMPDAIVRCKDCKHYIKSKRYGMMCGILVHAGQGDDFYCSYGERRAE